MHRTDEARAMAVAAHGDQKYGEEPYVVHLDAVAALCTQFGEDVVVVGYLHDTLEDTKLAKSEIEAKFGALVAACVDFLSDPPGPDRKTRKAAAYARLGSIAADAPESIALIVKAADRLANVRASVKNNPRLLHVYQTEHAHFRPAVFRPGLNDVLVKEIDSLLG